MPDDVSANLSLPFLVPSQAQKHVTHNEALVLLDALVQLAVLDRTRTVPPETPAEGDRHIVPAGAGAAWGGPEGAIAVRQGAAWIFCPPRPGWRCLVLEETLDLTFRGGSWRDGSDMAQSAVSLGINTAADAANRLAVAAPATLLTHQGAGHQLKINKAAPADTASLLFQTGWSGRAEMGLAGSDDFVVKVSADGAAWQEALRIEAGSGRPVLPNGAAIEGKVTGSAVVQGAADTTAGRLLTPGWMGLGSQTPPLAADLNDAGMITGFYRTGAATLGTFPPGVTADFDKSGCLLAMRVDAGSFWQSWWSLGRQQVWVRRRSGGWSSWRAAGGDETGTNANGDYARFANGTLICWHTTTATQLAAHYVRAGWTYPAVFAAVPALRVNPLLSSAVDYGLAAQRDRWGIAVAATVTAGSAVCDVYRSYGAPDIPATASVPLQLTAVGRWY